LAARYTLDRLHNKEKFQPCSKKGIFVGCSNESKAYRLWLPQEINISWDVKFLENHTNNDKTIESFADEGAIINFSIKPTDKNHFDARKNGDSCSDSRNKAIDNGSN